MTAEGTDEADGTTEKDGADEREGIDVEQWREGADDDCSPPTAVTPSRVSRLVFLDAMAVTCNAVGRAGPASKGGHARTGTTLSGRSRDCRGGMHSATVGKGPDATTPATNNISHNIIASTRGSPEENILDGALPTAEAGSE